MQTAIELTFADGSYTFDLGLAQINEIQNKTGDGIGKVYSRILKGRYLVPTGAFGNPLEAEYRIEDLVNVIRQGLIGGGKGIVDGQDVLVTTHRANQLVDNYVLGGQPLKEAWTVAAAIMTARIEGYDAPEKKPVEEPKKKAVRRVKAGSITPGPSPTAP